MKAQRPKSKPKRPKWKTQKKWTTKKPIKGNEGQERQDEIKAHKATMKDQNERKYIPQQKLTANKPLKIGPKLQSNGRPKVVQPNIFRGPTSFFSSRGPEYMLQESFNRPFCWQRFGSKNQKTRGVFDPESVDVGCFPCRVFAWKKKAPLVNLL